MFMSEFSANVSSSVQSAGAATTSDQVLTDEQLAGLLLVKTGWVRKNATELPGHLRCGRYHRFLAAAIERWLGSLDSLLDADAIAALLKLPRSWVYAHARELPGVMRI